MNAQWPSQVARKRGPTRRQKSIGSAVYWTVDRLIDSGAVKKRLNRIR
jgi:hypothetical protein